MQWAGKVGMVGLTVAVLAGGCGSAGDESDTGAPAELCSAYEQFVELEDELLAPEVFDLSAGELQSVLADRSRVAASMAEVADGDLGEALRPTARFDPAADEILVEAWREDRQGLPAAGDSWTTKALSDQDELVADDGARMATGDWFSRSTQRRELLYVTCVEPGLADGPDQDRAERAPDGLISYFRFADVATATGERLAVTTRGDEAESPFRLPTGWRSPLYGDAVGDRVVFNAAHGDRVGLLSFDLLSSDSQSDAEVAYDGDVPLSCPSLSSDGRSILAPEQSFSGDDRGVFEVRAEDVEPLGLDLALQGCTAAVGDDHLLVAPAAASLADPVTASLMTREGSDLRSIDLPAHCNVTLGDVHGTADRAALSLRCADPGDSGLWTVDLESFEVAHLVTGAVGTPKWSPDGEWLTFAYAPVETLSGHLDIWLVKADGTGAQELVEGGAFPIWLPER
ncbi:MAG: PD40 domain-containing protein [Acidimicrobiales bacterium]|nr:PD40 domain-containing protein [Acidimicrobiales bacterium]